MKNSIINMNAKNRLEYNKHPLLKTYNVRIFECSMITISFSTIHYLKDNIRKQI